MSLQVSGPVQTPAHAESWHASRHSPSEQQELLRTVVSILHPVNRTPRGHAVATACMPLMNRRPQLLVDEDRMRRFEGRATASGRSVASPIRAAIDVAYPDADVASCRAAGDRRLTVEHCGWKPTGRSSSECSAPRCLMNVDYAAQSRPGHQRRPLRARSAVSVPGLLPRVGAARP